MEIKSILFNLLRLLVSFLFELIFFFVLNIIFRFFVSIIIFVVITCLFILGFTFNFWLLILFIIITILLWNVHKLFCLGALLQLRWRARRRWWLELCILHVCKILIQEILSILTTSFISNINGQIELKV